jgi:succinylarginine dihydrolase
MPNALEMNFDGLVGPTHHYAALAAGNLASQAHGGSVSHPREAALQGLEKMKRVAELGAPQAVLPPHERPDLAFLRCVGFDGSDSEVLARALREAPTLLTAACSASSMWAANAATVSASADCRDGRIHLTPANLVTNLHRSLEPAFTTRILRRVLPDRRVFAVHDALPSVPSLGDEGAANHLRLCAGHDGPGVEVFVFGQGGSSMPRRFPARQQLAASQAVARLHGLDPRRTLFVQQHPDAIDAGVFHNDVIAVANRHVLLCHERAWVDQPRVLDQMRQMFRETCGGELHVIQVATAELSLAEAVASYLFNSQLVDLNDGTMALVCPRECVERPRVWQVITAKLMGENSPIAQAVPVEVRQSMQNGGGPACLRLRVPMTSGQAAGVFAGVRWSDALHERLSAWVTRHYRQELRIDDLVDPSLLRETRAALDELTEILRVGPVYGFQGGEAHA